MILSDAPGYDFRMTYYNADGSEAEMCGNGGRCMAMFAHLLGIGGSTKHFITIDGEHSARILSGEGESGIVELGMRDVAGYEFRDKALLLNTGVPHYVEFVNDADLVDVPIEGRAIRQSEYFMQRGGTNVDFVQIISDGHIKMRTYERGVEAETLACGTGAVAAAIATHIYIQNDIDKFAIDVPGGRLEVSFATTDDTNYTGILLTGPARMVFKGEVNIG
jgi:diaminopimelate epimerase